MLGILWSFLVIIHLSQKNPPPKLLEVFVQKSPPQTMSQIPPPSVRYFENDCTLQYGKVLN